MMVRILWNNKYIHKVWEWYFQFDWLKNMLYKLILCSFYLFKVTYSFHLFSDKYFKETSCTLFILGFDINAKMKNNWTPLLLAASMGNADIVDELINRGADVNTFNGNIFTPRYASAKITYELHRFLYRSNGCMCLSQNNIAIWKHLTNSEYFSKKRCSNKHKKSEENDGNDVCLQWGERRCRQAVFAVLWWRCQRQPGVDGKILWMFW